MKVTRRALLGAAAASSVTAASAGQSKTASTYRFTRDIPIDQGYDLAVAGGGPAGAAAAICAARLGAKVLLVEATGCLGGMGTSGLVTAFGPLSDGEKLLIRGLMKEILETLYHRGFIPDDETPDTWNKKFHVWTRFHPEGYKLLLDEMVTKAGVDVRFFTQVVDVQADRNSGRVDGYVLHNIEGYRYVRAKTFVDGTGDAVVANLCGAKCREALRDTPDVMPPSLCSMCSNIDFSRFHDQQKAVEQAVKDGFLSQPDLHLPGLFRTGATTASMNAGHMFDLDALRCKSLTDGVMLGRRLAQEYLAFYRKYVPGCEKMELVTTSPLAGIRESRRISGEYELNFQDYITRRQFPDQVAVYALALDIHPYKASVEQYERYRTDFIRVGKLNPGECYGIPYGVMIPKGWKNLWVAGRSISTDVKVHGSTRAQPVAIALGQAAANAALQAIRTRRNADEIDTGELIDSLRKSGAYLPQTRTSKQLTRTT
jgi:ribulose 1,5-bisphosphate synthetase/thiazole synthase